LPDSRDAQDLQVVLESLFLRAQRFNLKLNMGWSEWLKKTVLKKRSGGRSKSTENTDSRTNPPKKHHSKNGNSRHERRGNSDPRDESSHLRRAHSKHPVAPSSRSLASTPSLYGDSNSAKSSELRVVGQKRERRGYRGSNEEPVRRELPFDRKHRGSRKNAMNPSQGRNVRTHKPVEQPPSSYAIEPMVAAIEHVGKQEDPGTYSTEDLRELHYGFQGGHSNPKFRKIKS
jgi:hypothetical protein